jgi:hypothetical protein
LNQLAFRIRRQSKSTRSVSGIAVVDTGIS